MSVLVRLIPKNEPIKIRVGDAARKPIPTIRLELKIRKSINGDLMIFDHADIDIVLSSKNNKIKRNYIVCNVLCHAQAKSTKLDIYNATDFKA